MALLTTSAVVLAQPAPTDPRRDALLAANGFVVDGDTVLQDVQGSYTTLARNAEAVFVTSDAMLYLWHEVHRAVTSELELRRLWPLTQRLAARLWASHQAQLAGHPPAALKAAGEAQALRLAVALRLCDPGARLPDDLAPQADALVARVKAAAGAEPYPGEDYTQYRPRGHYADHPALSSYFRATKWLSRQPVPLAGDGASPARVRQAAWVVAALRRDGAALADYHRLTGVRRLLAGVSNGCDADDVDRALTAVLGAGWRLEALASGCVSRRARTSASAGCRC